jgi:hypothetical protein
MKKTRTNRAWILGLAVTLGWLQAGWAQDRPTTYPASILSPIREFPVSAGPPAARLSPWTRQILKLARAGISDDVMVSFVDNCGMFNLGAEDVIYLNDIGVSGDVISEMLRHDAEVIAGVRPLTIASDPYRDSPPTISFVQPTAEPNTAMPLGVTGATNPVVVLAEGAASLTVAGATNARPASLFDVALERQDVPTGFEPLPRPRRGSYPVREPYPVPLTAPIVVVRAHQPTPNTIVIEWLSGE